MAKDIGEYVAAHVSQATKTYNQLVASGAPIESCQQRGDTVYFRTQRNPPHCRSADAHVGGCGLSGLGGGVLLGSLAVLVGGGYLYWKSQWL